MKFLKLVFLLFILNFSCKRASEINYSSPIAGKCTVDASNVYHYVLPEKHGGGLPLLVILDSGGDGLMAVTKTIPALFQIPCVVVGSDLIRNNFQGFERAIDILIDDACKKFQASKDMVVIAGFSGGARMAFSYARNHRVMGVLMCGAGPDLQPSEILPCPVYMISGTTDFNFSETYYNPLETSWQEGFMSDYFSGSHEWPPAEMMEEAYLFLLGKSIPDGRRILKRESVMLSEMADSMLNHRGNTFFALKSVEKAIKLNPGNREAKKLFQKIKTNREFAEEIAKIEGYLQQENRIKQGYSTASMERDSIWWSLELQKLRQAIAGSSGEQKDHFLRLKGFLGILFYSRLNSLIRTEANNPRIVHLLSAYRMAEPENPDVYYDYALYELKTGKEESCRKNLDKAVSLGFSDKGRLENDFPEDFLKSL
jgi:hypothetical protein